MFLLLTIFLISIVFYIWSFYAKVNKYPKGPPPIPLFGNTLQINLKTFYKDIDTIAKQYGPIFTVWLPEPIVFVSEYEHLREVFIKNADVTSGRGKTLADRFFRKEPNTGVVNSDGDKWVHQRRTSIAILRDLGMGKNKMNEMVTLSINEALDQMNQLGENELERFNPTETIQLFTSSVLTKLLFGIPYSTQNGERLLELMHIIHDNSVQLRSSSIVGLFLAFPWLEDVPVLGRMLSKKFTDAIETFMSATKENVQESLKDYDPSIDPECFVQGYYRKMQTDEHLSLKELVECAADFFAAGLDTTASTLRWAFIYFAEHQDVQTKLREEIQSVIGNREATVSDRPNLPYTNAVIMEVQRMASVVAINLTHRTTDDLQINGYKIPINTRLIPQVGTVLHSSPVFDHSDEFRPERFLLNDGKTLNKTVADQVMPFSLGKRQCAGEGLARLEIFLGITIFFQKYKVQPCDGQKIDFSTEAAIVLQPTPQHLKFTKIVV